MLKEESLSCIIVVLLYVQTVQACFGVGVLNGHRICLLVISVELNYPQLHPGISKRSPEYQELAQKKSDDAIVKP